MIDAGEVRTRLDALTRRIDRAGGRGRVRIVAVTKGFGPDAIDAAVEAGCTAIGENYAQELLAKLPLVRVPMPELHFIGQLQRRKVRQLTGVVDVWQTVDRDRLVDELVARVPGAQVMVEVNVSGEPQKGGCSPDDVTRLVGRARDGGLQVLGLMTVGPAGPPEGARSGFRLLRRIADDLGIPDCSMGMSDDVDVAVEEGATVVRIGTALFGPRPLGSAGAQ